MLKEYMLGRCECGAPRILGSTYKWKKNGVMVNSMNESMRMAFCNAELLDNVLAEVQEKLGVSIEQFAYEASRNTTRKSFAELPKKTHGLIKLKKFNPVKHMIMKVLQLFSLQNGYGYVSIVDYVPRTSGVAYVKNPFSRDIVGAAIMGALEFLDDVPYDFSWSRATENEFLLKAMKQESKPAISSRFESDYMVVTRGDIGVEICPRCGVPLGVSRLMEWREDEGLILGRASGSRFVIISFDMVKVIIREFQEELGDVTEELFLEAQRDLTIQQVSQFGNELMKSQELEGSFKEFIDRFAVLGYGNPISITVNGKEVEIVIENPADDIVVGGTILGLYDVLMSGKGALKHDPQPEARVKFTVTPG